VTSLQSPSQDLLMLLLLQAVDVVLVAGRTAVCAVTAAAAVAMVLKI